MTDYIGSTRISSRGSTGYSYCCVDPAKFNKLMNVNLFQF